jgi:hypothetical protein
LDLAELEFAQRAGLAGRPALLRQIPAKPFEPPELVDDALIPPHTADQTPARPQAARPGGSSDTRHRSAFYLRWLEAL